MGQAFEQRCGLGGMLGHRGAVELGADHGWPFDLEEANLEKTKSKGKRMNASGGGRS
jgi:hypothetical protein